MGLRSIDLFHVAVPLKKPIRHASHERTSSDNLVVRVTLDDGQQGYRRGGPPRLRHGRDDRVDVRHPGELRRGPTPRHAPELRRRRPASRSPVAPGDRGRSARDGRELGAVRLELAILDAYGHRFGQSLGKAIPMMETDGVQATDSPRRVRYSGAITADDPRRERIAAWKMRLYGFSQTKLKVGVAGQDDPARLAKLRRILGRRMDLRLDANEAWTAAEVVDRVRPLLAFSPSALEQPVPHAEVDSLAELRPQTRDAGDARRVALRLSRRGPRGRGPHGRPVQRPALEMRRDRADPADRGPGTPIRPRGPARLPPGRDRPPLGGGPARRGPRADASAMSRARTTATSWPPTSRSKTPPSATAAGPPRSSGRAWESGSTPRPSTA